MNAPLQSRAGVPFVVIAVTLVVQGLTLAPLIRRLHVGEDWSHQEEHRQALLALSRAAALAIDDAARRDDIAGNVSARIHAEFAEKIAESTADGPTPGVEAAQAQRLRRAAIEAERRELIRIWRDNQISDDVLHQLEENLDYQESRL